jgi:hypothetical protein
MTFEATLSRFRPALETSEGGSEALERLAERSAAPPETAAAIFKRGWKRFSSS